LNRVYTVNNLSVHMKVGSEGKWGGGVAGGHRVNIVIASKVRN